MSPSPNTPITCRFTASVRSMGGVASIWIGRPWPSWCGVAAYHLAPVVDRMLTHLRRSGRLFMDETRAPVLDPGAGKIEPWCATGSSTMARDRLSLGADPR